MHKAPTRTCNSCGYFARRNESGVGRRTRVAYAQFIVASGGSEQTSDRSAKSEESNTTSLSMEEHRIRGHLDDPVSTFIQSVDP